YVQAAYLPGASGVDMRTITGSPFSSRSARQKRVSPSQPRNVPSKIEVKPVLSAQLQAFGRPPLAPRRSSAARQKRVSPSQPRKVRSKIEVKPVLSAQLQAFGRPPLPPRGSTAARIAARMAGAGVVGRGSAAPRPRAAGCAAAAPRPLPAADAPLAPAAASAF